MLKWESHWIRPLAKTKRATDASGSDKFHFISTGASGEAAVDNGDTAF